MEFFQVTMWKKCTGKWTNANVSSKRKTFIKFLEYSKGIRNPQVVALGGIVDVKTSYNIIFESHTAISKLRFIQLYHPNMWKETRDFFFYILQWNRDLKMKFLLIISWKFFSILLSKIEIYKWSTFLLLTIIQLHSN